MNKTYKQNFIKAGAIAAQVRSFGKSLIKKGASYNEVISQIQNKIAELGAKPAFPPQIALNYVAAHFLPKPDEDILFTDQVVKLDVGICVNGAIGDCAVTIDLSEKYQSLVDAAEAALLAAEQNVKVGMSFSDLGKIIEETIASYGFRAVKNLSGHGLGHYQIHTSPSVPNYRDGSKAVIKPGMTFAIEPFATDGKGLIREEGIPTIFSFLKSRPISSAAARLLLKKIGAHAGLPFAIHDLIGKDISREEAWVGIFELLKAGVIDGYPPLVEDPHCMVAQAENSVLVDDDGNVFVTTR